MNKLAGDHQLESVGLYALMRTVKEGRIAIAESLIRLGADINGRDKEGLTPLMHAGIRNKVSVMHMLLHHSADLNRRDYTGKTALIHAVRQNKRDVVALLLLRGADSSLADTKGITPLMYACQTANVEIVHLLCEANADVNLVDSENMSALMYAAMFATPEIVADICDSGADVHHRDDTNRSALDYAALHGKAEILRILCARHTEVKTINLATWDSLKSLKEDQLVAIIDVLSQFRIDVNQVDRFGKSALTKACINRQSNVVKKLVRLGANVNKADTEGMTPLMYAASKNGARNVEMITTLCKSGARVDQVDKNGMSAFIWATKFNSPAAICKLFELGADINLTDKQGMSALMHAVELGDKWLVRTLCEHGADVNLTKNKHRHPLHAYARPAKKKFFEVVKCIQPAEKRGFTALMFASQMGHVDIVRTLCAYDADPTVTAMNGKSALAIAGENGHRDVVKILQERLIEHLEWDTNDNYSSEESGEIETTTASYSAGTARHRFFLSSEVADIQVESDAYLAKATPLSLPLHQCG